MAEGDSILRAAKRIDAALAGQAVSVRAPSPRGRAAGVGALDGRRLRRAESHGKNLLLRFDAGLVLHSHLGMNGSWHLYATGARWGRPARQAWVALTAEDREAVQFGGSTLRVLEERRMRLDPVLGRLGPDILAADFDPAAAAASLRAAGPDRELGDALLDQRLLAGVGHIFKSEGCFAAGVDPRRALGELPEDQLLEAIGATRELMAEAVRSGRHPHEVYRRAGRRCRRCGATVRSRGQGDANRSSYWCEGCQR